MYLGDRSINPPARAHLAPVQDESLLNWMKFGHACLDSVISVYSEINILLQTCKRDEENLGKNESNRAKGLECPFRRFHMKNFNESFRHGE